MIILSVLLLPLNGEGPILGQRKFGRYPSPNIEYKQKGESGISEQQGFFDCVSGTEFTFFVMLSQDRMTVQFKGMRSKW